MGQIKRLLAGCFAALTAALVALSIGVTACAASDSTRVILSVTQSFVNRSSATVYDSFQYELTPLEEGNPLPGANEERYRFSIRGSADKLLMPITFRKVGVYRYQLRQVIPEKKLRGYTYDERVYTVEIYVTNAAGSLTAATVVNSQDGEKTDEIFFENSYERPVSPTIPGSPPKTGDSVDPRLWIGLLILGALGLLVTQRMGKTRQTGEDTQTTEPDSQDGT